MSSASFYKCRAKFGGMDASMISEMSMQNDLLKEALGKKR
jgi:putative transposase